MHVHEFLYYTISIADPQQINSRAIICVTNFNHRNWSIYNHINVLIHHLAPFAIQITAITLLIISAAKSRARTGNNQATTFTQI
ncbi:unnamed protein product [Adineta steineri]|nr:unnamed protein product [Adineta steineri]